MLLLSNILSPSKGGNVKTKKHKMKTVYLFLVTISPFFIQAQSTVGLIDYQTGNDDGYVLFAPGASTSTYLIDKCGNKVREWTSTYRPGLSCYLLEDGSLLRTGILDNPNFDEGGSGGIIEKYDWDGNLTWSYVLSDDDHCQHHDIKCLPNGNILAIVWDRYTSADAIDQGKNTSYTNDYLWSEKIVELQPLGTNDATVVWEWKLWNHLVQDFDNTKPNFGVVTDHPELVNINYFPGQPTSMDWIHFNSIDYNPTLDQIVISSHTMCEFWIIDHSTSTSEAATHNGGNSGKGGDLLYRWGNPQAYQRGNPSTKKLYGQHHATWIPEGFPNEGKILVFNNGLNRPSGDYSSIEIVETPLDGNNLYPIGVGTAYEPTSAFWTYTAPTPTDFYGSNISGVYPLENGSFMITNGPSGTFFELDTNEEIVWKYISPINNTGILSQGTTPSNNIVFRCTYYPSSYSAFTGQTLTDLGEIELNPVVPSICEVFIGIDNLEIENTLFVYPNPIVDEMMIQIPEGETLSSVEILNSLGQFVFIGKDSTIDLSGLDEGVYFLKVRLAIGEVRTFKIQKTKSF